MNFWQIKVPKKKVICKERNSEYWGKRIFSCKAICTILFSVQMVESLMPSYFETIPARVPHFHLVNFGPLAAT